MIAKTPRQTPPEGSKSPSAVQGTLRLITGLVGGVSCLSMAITLYRTWQTPMAVEGGRSFWTIGSIAVRSKRRAAA